MKEATLHPPSHLLGDLVSEVPWTSWRGHARDIVNELPRVGARDEVEGEVSLVNVGRRDEDDAIVAAATIMSLWPIGSRDCRRRGSCRQCKPLRLSAPRRRQGRES